MRLRWYCLVVAIVSVSWVSGCTRTTPAVKDASIEGEYLPRAGPRGDLIRETWRHLGAPYRYGGAGPGGFDCSGLVHYVHRKVGINTPRTTAAQRAGAQHVALTELESGDLLFFSIDEGKGRHVAIYEGKGVFIHAPSKGKLVSRAHLSDPYWRARVVGAGSYF